MSIVVDGPDDIVMMLMTQHWDMVACMCWVCEAGRAAGLHSTSDFLNWRQEGFGYIKPDDPDQARREATEKSPRSDGDWNDCGRFIFNDIEEATP